jgi:hypothetical protein
MEHRFRPPLTGDVYASAWPAFLDALGWASEGHVAGRRGAVGRAAAWLRRIRSA